MDDKDEHDGEGSHSLTVDDEMVDAVEARHQAVELLTLEADRALEELPHRVLRVGDLHGEGRPLPRSAGGQRVDRAHGREGEFDVIHRLLDLRLHRRAHRNK